MDACNDCEHGVAKTRIYLDHAATTPLTEPARRAMADALVTWANPSSVHEEGRTARAALEAARRRILKGLGARPTDRLVFTSGASEALALALGRAHVTRLLVSATEHDAVLRAAPNAERIPVDHLGRIDMEALSRVLAATQGQSLVAVQHANNETGVIQDISAIAELVRASEGILLVDAAQSAGKLPLPEADFVAVSAHKLGGPPGIGALILRDDRLMEPSGGQERGLRGGTENLPGILGFAAALDAPGDWTAKTTPLRDRLERGVTAAGGAVIAATSPRVPWISALHMPGVPAATQLMHFDLAGIAVSAGAACSSGSMKPSHVLTAMGYESGAVEEVIRVSFAPSTTDADVERFLEAWRALQAKTRVEAA